jgi:hypothetical protein
VRGWICVVFAVAAVAASGPVAGAAPPWEPPRTVARSTTELWGPAIEFGAGGTALLSWVEGSVGGPAVTRLATMLRDGSVVPRGGLRGVFAARPQYYRRERVVLVRARRRGRPSRRTGLGRYRIEALFGATSNTFRGRLRRVATFSASPGTEVAAVGSDDRGEVAVAWVEFHQRGSSPGTYRVRVALGREERGFGRPQTLASWPLARIDDSPSVAVAYGAGGDLLVAHTTMRREGRRDRRLVAARVRRRGEAFGRAQVLGPRQASTQLTAAAAPDGRMVVTWASQDGGEEAERRWWCGRRCGRQAGGSGARSYSIRAARPSAYPAASRSA